ncbi:coniferyl aldehyde dehydrogenase [Psychrobacter sp.]|jgi:coniferyl-aldehyde dehydrogenase|uniref:coniferyl aldehyde dehydrogenase n=1 Tax=Psychrobacter sp. TaxID=56811 RepID=UPI003104ADE8|tara:strand:- start:120 stop:1577 length:1458 start_codon:yes stop_codon:yes gene_type:complete
MTSIQAEAYTSSLMSNSSSIITNREQLQTQFSTLQTLSRTKPILDWPTRKSQLDTLELLLSENKEKLTQAINADFGQRSEGETKFAELFSSFTGISHAKKHGKSWMKTRKAPVSAVYLPARNEIEPQPLGVVGIMVPWNYPLYLAIGPMIDALTAGNRVMVKMSEAAPQFAQAFAEAMSQYFSADMVSVVVGDIDIAVAFSQLPFDHLIYTGSTEVGKKIMAAAAPNLTPVTLELGGKSPVVVLEDANLERAVNRIMTGKTLNAGQTCIAPDYVLIDRKHHAQFVTLAKQWMRKHYPNIMTNEDYTHIIDNVQFNRVQGYLAKISEDNIHHTTDVRPDIDSRFMPPVIVTEPATDSELMQNEIFAPVLPLIHYSELDEAITFINERPRPLALYVFGESDEDIKRIRSYTVSGGVCVNEIVLHALQHELPFGGVGHSGMGSYHGKSGFERFSHMKPVLVQPKMNAMNLLQPPYGFVFNKFMSMFIK